MPVFRPSSLPLPIRVAGLTMVLGALLTACGGGGLDDGSVAGGGGTVAGEVDLDAQQKAPATLTTQRAALTKWSSTISLPLVPVSGAVMNNGKVLMWSADANNSFSASGITRSVLFDPSTNSAVYRSITETSHTMFCPGTSRLPDGRLLVNGGIDDGKTSIYDPVNNTWTAGAAMAIPRAYQGTAPLADGSIFTLGGGWRSNSGGKDAEVYTVAGGWRRLTGINDSEFYLNGPNSSFTGWPTNAHYNLIQTGNGKVLFAGPAVDMKWIDTSGAGSYSPAGRRGDDSVSLGGNTVMYDAGRILKVGGASQPTGAAALATAYVIDTNSGDAVVTRLPDMAYPRIYSNSIVLPGGQVIVIGGQTFSKEFYNDNAVLVPEIFDPQSNTFTPMPAMSVPRNYHSIAMLLPDGRVISAGGGLSGCNCDRDHPDLQIMSPPYLFNADGTPATRPVISAAPATVGYGTRVAVNTDSPVQSFSMIRLGAVTHTVNNDQRRVSLTFTATDPTHYQVDIPDNPGILLPGQWMLFAMNADGTPSIASIVTVSNTGAPILTNPGTVNALTGRPISVAVNATTPGGTLTYSASGLPAGLSINPSTGVISGSTSVAGRFTVTVRVSNGSQTVSTNVVFDVGSAGTGSGLLAQYFNNTNLSGAPVLQRVEAVNFDWGTGAPGAGVPADNFSARWIGSIEAVRTGATSISTLSDDGVRVWVDNKLVIDNWTPHAPTTNAGTINLVAGQRYPVMVEFYEAGGGATMRLQWQPAGTTTVVPVPVDRLYAGQAPSTTNLARGMATSQSTPYNGVLPARAVDGNVDGNFGANSTTHTAGAAQDWWQVDLGRTAKIDLLQLWNRSDCCLDRLNNFTVLVSSSDMTGRSLAQLQNDATVIKRQVGVSNVVPMIGVPINDQGRYVRVQLNGTNYLSLAEVQVFGTVIANYQAPVVQSIGEQQSNLGGQVTLGVSARDLDGNALTYSATGIPPGVSLNASTGVFSGTTTTAGTYTVTVTVANGGKSATTSFNWIVLDRLPTVTTLNTPVAGTGSSVSYAPTLAAGAVATYSWNFGDGTAATAYSSSAAVNHTFAAAGVYTVTLTILTEDGRVTTYRFVQAVADAGSGGVNGASARGSSNLLIEPRINATARLWVANADNDTVSVFDTSTRAKAAEITVGVAPRSLARAADGRIWVVNRDAATISIINPSTLVVAQTVALPRASQPYGIVFGPTDGFAYVTLQATGQLLKLNGTTGAQVASLAVGDNPRHLALTAAGDALLVSRFITRSLPGEGTRTPSTVDANGAKVGGEVLVVSPASLSLQRTVVLAHSDRLDSESQGRGIPNYLGVAAISPNGKSAWIPSKQDNIKRGVQRDGNNLTFETTVRAISSSINVVTGQEDLVGRVDHDNAGVASAALYHGSGAYVFVALETNRQVAVLDPVGKRELFRIEVGFAPQGLALAADGMTLYVSNMIDRSVSLIDLRPLVQSGQYVLAPIATINAVQTEKLAAGVLQGKRLFYDARDTRLARDSYISCASCHNDGGHDGRTWDFTGQGEGLRNTIALKGRAGTGQGFLHWSANFDEVQDFEGQIRGLQGGAGLMNNSDFNAGTRSQPLGDKKAGVSADLDALAAYVTSLTTFAPSPYRNADGSLTASATAGKQVFQANNCASCHTGSSFTRSGDASQLADIGTIPLTGDNRLGVKLTGYDVPTLRDVWSSGPYLHDGSMATISGAISAHRGVSLSSADINNLVDYVRQIGGEESAAPANVTPSPILGGSAGTAFSDPVAAGQNLTGVVVRAGWWIDSIQGLATPTNLPLHGGAGGAATTVTWPAGDKLIRIYGDLGSNGYVARISFVTSSGKVYGPYGTGQGGMSGTFNFTAPAGSRIVGFTGRSGTYLNAIGALYGQ